MQANLYLIIRLYNNIYSINSNCNNSGNTSQATMKNCKTQLFESCAINCFFAKLLRSYKTEDFDLLLISLQDAYYTFFKPDRQAFLKSKTNPALIQKIMKKFFLLDYVQCCKKDKNYKKQQYEQIYQIIHQKGIKQFFLHYLKEDDAIIIQIYLRLLLILHRNIQQECQKRFHDQIQKLMGVIKVKRSLQGYDNLYPEQFRKIIQNLLARAEPHQLKRLQNISKICYFDKQLKKIQTCFTKQQSQLKIAKEKKERKFQATSVIQPSFQKKIELLCRLPLKLRYSLIKPLQEDESSEQQNKILNIILKETNIDEFSSKQNVNSLQNIQESQKQHKFHWNELKAPKKVQSRTIYSKTNSLYFDDLEKKQKRQIIQRKKQILLDQKLGKHSANQCYFSELINWHQNNSQQSNQFILLTQPNKKQHVYFSQPDNE